MIPAPALAGAGDATRAPADGANASHAPAATLTPLWDDAHAVDLPWGGLDFEQLEQLEPSEAGALARVHGGRAVLSEQSTYTPAARQQLALLATRIKLHKEPLRCKLLCPGGEPLPAPVVAALHPDQLSRLMPALGGAPTTTPPLLLARHVDAGNPAAGAAPHDYGLFACSAVNPYEAMAEYRGAFMTQPEAEDAQAAQLAPGGGGHVLRALFDLGLPRAFRKRAPPRAIEVTVDGAPCVGAGGVPLSCVAAMANDCADWSAGAGAATCREPNADVFWMVCARECHGPASEVHAHGMLCALEAGIPQGAEVLLDYGKGYRGYIRAVESEARAAAAAAAAGGAVSAAAAGGACVMGRAARCLTRSAAAAAVEDDAYEADEADEQEEEDDAAGASLSEGAAGGVYHGMLGLEFLPATERFVWPEEGAAAAANGTDAPAAPAAPAAPGRDANGVLVVAAGAGEVAAAVASPFSGNPEDPFADLLDNDGDDENDYDGALCFGGEDTRGTSGLGFGRAAPPPPGTTTGSTAADAPGDGAAAAVRSALGRGLEVLLHTAAQLGMRVELTVSSGGADGDVAGAAADGAAAALQQQRRVVCRLELRAQDGGDALVGALAPMEREQAEREAEARAELRAAEEEEEAAARTLNAQRAATAAARARVQALSRRVPLLPAASSGAQQVAPPLDLALQLASSRKRMHDGGSDNGLGTPAAFVTGAAVAAKEARSEGAA